MENQHPLRATILSLRNWVGAARLPKAFRKAGFHVSTLAFPGLLIGRCQVDSAAFLPERASDDELLSAVRKALVELAPSIVIPADDAAVELLQAAALAPADAAFRRLMEDSLGEFAQRRTVRSRQALARFAGELAVRTPAQTSVHDLEQALAFAARHGYPAVFKAEESFAGLGVSICRDEESLRGAISRTDPRALAAGLLAQSFVEGKTAMRAVVAFRGRVLGGLSAIKVETHPGSTGPSSVVEVIDHPEMTETANRVVQALGFSGFASLDFQLDGAGAAHLIELNPRPTPICHLGPLFDADLCLALRHAMTGEPREPAAPRGVPRKVVLFPQEWVRRHDSPHFADGAYHDVPWDEPELLEGFVRHGRTMAYWGEYRREEQRRERLRALIDEHEAGGDP